MRLRCWQRVRAGVGRGAEEQQQDTRVNEGVHELSGKYVTEHGLIALSETKGDNGTRASRFVGIQAEPQKSKHRETPKGSLSHASYLPMPSSERVSVSKQNFLGCELKRLFNFMLELLVALLASWLSLCWRDNPCLRRSCFGIMSRL